MFRFKKFFAWLSLVLVIALAACSFGSQSTPTLDANTIYTAAAATVGAELTRSANLTPSATATIAATFTETPVPTTPAPTTATLADTPTVTIPPTATLSIVPDKAQFVSQTIADGTQFTAGQAIKMSWVIKNTGTSTWTTAYAAKFYAGEQMGAPASVPLTQAIKPGTQIEIIVNFVAPATAGAKRSIWVLQNPDGINFYSFYLDIKVVAATATKVPPTSTKAPTVTKTVKPTVTTTVTPP